MTWMTAGELIAENNKRFPTLSDEEIAKRVIADLRSQGNWEQAIKTLILNAVRNSGRSVTRNLEKKAFAGGIPQPSLSLRNTGPRIHKGASIRGGTRPVVTGIDHVQWAAEFSTWTTQNTEMLHSKVPLGGRRKVLWGDLTVKDHKARIAFLAKERDGLNETIANHESAITFCEMVGVDTLNHAFEAARQILATSAKSA